MQDQLQKAINLAKKTGDKLIVFDSSKPENVFVVLSLKDYENLVLGKSEVRGLTEDELLDKINRDIAIWKSDQSEAENIETIPDYFKELPAKEERFEKTVKKSGSSWSIPSRRKLNAEEIIEEDRQYLEELAF
ncbi:MAG: hypothetical protein WCV70_03420 [Patescibacteria group bacterium]|jgi:hypothetical protein